MEAAMVRQQGKRWVENVDGVDCFITTTEEVTAKETLKSAGMPTPCDQAGFVATGRTDTPYAQSINWHCDCHGWHFGSATMAPAEDTGLHDNAINEWADSLFGEATPQ